MPVLKVKKDGVWEELGGTSPADGGNADTLDGKHALYFATASDVSNLQSMVGDKPVSEQINTAVLNKADKHITAAVTLSTSKWSNNTQTVSVTGVTANNTVFATHAPSSYTTYRDCGVRMNAQGSGSLTFVCDNTPTENIVVNIAIFN